MRDFAGVSNPKDMADGTGENVGGTLKRPHPLNEDTAIPEEDANCIFGGLEDVIKESLLKDQNEVIEFPEIVAKQYRKGPVTHLLESISKVIENFEIELAEVPKPPMRRYTVNGDTGGGEEDLSEVRLSKIREEVIELAEIVSEYREKGPNVFKKLLEKFLPQMRSSLLVMDALVDNTAEIDGLVDNMAEIDALVDDMAGMEDVVAFASYEELAKIRKLLERIPPGQGSMPTALLSETIASDKETISSIMLDIRYSKTRIEKAVTARRQMQAKRLPLHPLL